MKTMRIIAAIRAAMCILGCWAEPPKTEPSTPSTVSTSSTEPKPGEEHTIAGIEMVWIPAGEFMMGSELSAEEVASRYADIVGDYTNEQTFHRQ